MSGEKNQRQRVIKALATLHAFSVENMVHPGTPDVAFVGGWLECKCCKEWPRRGGVLKGEVDRKHFTNQQRLFCRTWRRKLGFHSIFLQVADDWMLLEPVAAADHLGIDWTEEDIRAGAWWMSEDGLNEIGFIDAIRTATFYSAGWEPE